jgi:protein-disulfide isomerase
MRFRLALVLLIAPAALVAAGPGKAPARSPAPRAPAARDWSQVVTATPEGGFRMGNPNARLKLVEFGSISCPHCAAFNAEGVPVLRAKYIRSGRLSWEYRPIMIFPTDPGVFLLLSCLGPGGFFSTSGELYSQQSQWTGKLGNLPAAEQERIGTLSLQEQAAAFVRAAGVDQILRQRGMSPDLINSGLADEPRLLRLVDVSRAASALGVTGTPMFLLNGRLLDGVYDWEDLEPHLKQSG